jgi:pyruvate,water dikinase
MLIKNLFKYWTFQVFSPGTMLKKKYHCFQTLLEHDKASHEYLAMLEDIYYNGRKCDFQHIVSIYEQFSHAVFSMVDALLQMCPSRYWGLRAYVKKFDFYIRFMLAPEEYEASPPFTMDLDAVPKAGEKTAGNKAFSLAIVMTALDLPVPRGFVITTHAFHRFMAINDLHKPVNRLLAELDISDPDSLKHTAGKIQALIMAAAVPEDIEAAVFQSLEKLKKDGTGKNGIALRSTAVKEDTRTSFAGQYKTLINVRDEDILAGYKTVIAGKYSEQALFYRISHGILDSETPMAVMALEMIDAISSGVIYTRDTGMPSPENLLVHSVWGQGSLLVDGQTPCDVFQIRRSASGIIDQIQIAKKDKQVILDPDQQTRTVMLDPVKAESPSLEKDEVLVLGRWGIRIEAYFNTAQDIEWCMDKDRNLYILQARPLNITLPPEKEETPAFLPDQTAVICTDAETICPGIGTGPVFLLDDLSTLPEVPQGAVLAARHASPGFVTAVHRLGAVVIRSGSRASHFSSVLREFHIPAIVNVKKGFDGLTHGKFVTVDANRANVYEGFMDMTSSTAPKKNPLFDRSSFNTKLRYLINFSSPLKLKDPESENFVPESVRSLHDIIRFTHEKAVQEMFFMGSRTGSRKMGARKLILGIPMLFYLLDVGGGTKKQPEKQKQIYADDITCVPMKAVIKGLLDPGICWTETTHFDWEEYDKIVMNGGIISADDASFGSYAVVARDYMNVNFRFGYHFVILDTRCTAEPDNNYILFRFSGGGGSPEGRLLRAVFIKKILTRSGFIVDLKSDLIDARLEHVPFEEMEQTLEVTGRLLGATKIMDMYIKEDQDMDTLAAEFIDGRSDFRSIV